MATKSAHSYLLPCSIKCAQQFTLHSYNWSICKNVWKHLQTLICSICNISQLCFPIWLCGLDGTIELVVNLIWHWRTTSTIKCWNSKSITGNLVIFGVNITIDLLNWFQDVHLPVFLPGKWLVNNSLPKFYDSLAVSTLCASSIGFCQPNIVLIWTMQLYVCQKQEYEYSLALFWMLINSTCMKLPRKGGLAPNHLMRSLLPLASWMQMNKAFLSVFSE